MTTADLPTGPVPAASGRARAGLPGRLLRLELRRNTMLLMLPLIAGLFCLDTFSASMRSDTPPLGALIQHHLFLDVGPLVAGGAARMGSRDGRRGMSDLVAATARSRWTSLLSTWWATTVWALIAYAGCAAVLTTGPARESGWTPAWWVAVCGANVVLCCAFGFAVGVFFPGRFTAALTSVAVFFAVPATYRGGYAATGGFLLLSPVNAPFEPQVFHPYLPDLSVDQLMFLIGLAVAALGALGLPASSGGRRLRRVAALVTAVGLASAATAFTLAGTARLEPTGVDIPALHDAANDRPVAYTPVCGHTSIPVCLHPDYLDVLPATEAALGPLFGEVSGLPGAPVRVVQVATPVSPQTALEPAYVSGSPPVLYVPLYAPTGSTPTDPDDFAALVQWQAGPAVIDAVVTGRSHSAAGDPAQQAVEAGLLEAAGVSLTSPGKLNPGDFPPDIAAPAPGSAQAAAAHRFAALTPAARHAWLAAHLSALRAGLVTVAQLP